MSWYMIVAFASAALVGGTVFADTGSLVFAFFAYSWAGAMALFGLVLIEMAKETEADFQ